MKIVHVNFILLRVSTSPGEMRTIQLLDHIDLLPLALHRKKVAFELLHLMNRIGNSDQPAAESNGEAANDASAAGRPQAEPGVVEWLLSRKRE